MFQDLNPEKARDPFFVYILTINQPPPQTEIKSKNIQGLYISSNIQDLIRIIYIGSNIRVHIISSNIMVLIRFI